VNEPGEIRVIETKDALGGEILSTVMIKCADEATVEFVELEGSRVKLLATKEFDQRCGSRVFMLDESLRVTNPQEFRRQSKSMLTKINKARKVCGLESVGSRSVPSSISSAIRRIRDVIKNQLGR